MRTDESRYLRVEVQVLNKDLEQSDVRTEVLAQRVKFKVEDFKVSL